MKGLQVFVAVLLAALPCWAADPPAPVTCTQEGGDAAARLAMQHINDQHHHGYKFNLSKIRSSSVEQGESECKVLLELDLLETKCHTINPKHFKDCELREQSEGQVKDDCNVTVTIKDDVAVVTKYDCNTERAMSAEELVKMCPDCPTLLPLNDAGGLTAVRAAVHKFNTDITNPRYYVLRDVGRISSGYIMTGIQYYAEFALVETHCPMGSRIRIEACKPLCPDRAHHAFCSSTYYNGESSIECEIYEPLISKALEEEPVCDHPPGHPVAPPLDAAGRGPPRPSLDQLPEGANPPPVQAGLPPFHPLRPPRRCHGAVLSDPAIYPICPWPHRQPYPRKHPSDEGTPTSP